MAKWRSVVHTESANLGVQQGANLVRTAAGEGLFDAIRGLGTFAAKGFGRDQGRPKIVKTKTRGGRRGGGLPRWGHELLGL